MRKANQPLTIWVHKEWADRQEIRELRDKGHSVVYIEGTPDLILHPGAHRWNSTMWEFWPAVKAVIRQITGEKRAK